MWRKLSSLGIRTGAPVLDAPCGAGYFALTLAEAGFAVTAADIAEEAAGRLGAAFRRADLGEPLPWPAASFAAVFCLEGIEHLENRFAFLREAARVLEPGGVLVLTTPNTVSVRSRVRFFGSGFFHQDPRPLREARREPLHHIGLATLPDLRYALHTSGFRVELVSHSHIKPISVAYAALVPWMWLYTLVAFRKEKDSEQRRRNAELRRALFTRSALLGENLLLVARRVGRQGAD